MTHIKQLLSLLEKSGSAGVNSYDLTYLYGMKQGPARIKDLQALGHIIKSVAPDYPRSKKSVNYVLLHKPEQPRHKAASPQLPHPWEEKLVPVEKNGYIYWEKPEDVEPKQEVLL